MMIICEILSYLILSYFNFPVESKLESINGRVQNTRRPNTELKKAFPCVDFSLFKPDLGVVPYSEEDNYNAVESREDKFEYIAVFKSRAEYVLNFLSGRDEASIAVCFM